MNNFIVATSLNQWQEIEGARVISAKQYIHTSDWPKRARIFNVCNSYAYQSLGYYVSLLATARGHKVYPAIDTIQHTKYSTLSTALVTDVHHKIQSSLKSIQANKFSLTVYFGKNIADRHAKLARTLYSLFQAPLLRAEFRKSNDWHLHSINTMDIKDVPEVHKEFFYDAARMFFSTAQRTQQIQNYPYTIAILHDPKEESPPSDEIALKRFCRSAMKHKMLPVFINKNDYDKLPKFDALFIRETTSVNDHTYRFARLAAAEGLAVIDNPNDIERCTNKVFLAEILARHKIPHPKTLIVHKKNVGEIVNTIGLPCVLKKPDSSFSQGVYKATSEEELASFCKEIFATTELCIAQEFVPTEFDWRIGIFEGSVLYVCKYYMAHKHWQIYKSRKSGKPIAGKWETLSIDKAPASIVANALAATKLIGNGLYGVDMKEVNGKAIVIEVNDNPSIDSDVEDQYLKEKLYDTIMQSFLRRIENETVSRIRN